MDDTKELLQRARERFVPPEDVMGSLIRRRARKERNRKLSAGAIALVLALLSLAFLARTFRDADRPAERPRPGGIFSHVGGWIAYADRGGKGGIWAVNPAAPGDPKDRILLSPGTGWPVAWSSDGSRLLILRRNTEPPPPPQTFLGSNLFVLNADGTETRLTRGDAYIEGGSFSPDGSKVVYGSGFGGKRSRIYEVDAAGGAPHVLFTAPEPEELYAPTFSPDGSTIAYFAWNGGRYRLRALDAAGGGSRLLSHETFKDSGYTLRLVWSPDGTRLAIDYGGHIYTIRADGSDLTLLIPHGRSPNWSPDSSRIAYNHGPYLVIADADGKHPKEYGYARSGPWNPLVSEPAN